MATVAKQSFTYNASDSDVAPISSAQAINQGDMLQIVSGLAVPAATATAAIFGVSKDTNPVSSLGDTLVQVAVNRGGNVHLMKLPSGTVDFDQKLYLGADAQTVTPTDPGSGVAVGRSRSLAQVVGGSGVTIEVKLEVA